MARTPQTASDRFDDEHYPAYTMGRAAKMLGATPGFLRSLDEMKLLDPQRSPGGHRRYSRYQLRLAGRVRALIDQGTALDAACRIVVLEDQLDEARRLNTEMHQRTPRANHPRRHRPPIDQTHSIRGFGVESLTARKAQVTRRCRSTETAFDHSRDEVVLVSKCQ